MSDTKDHGGSPGYETSDAHAGATLRAGAYILGAMFLVAAILVPAYWFLARREAVRQPRPASVIRATPSPGAFPRLLTDEPVHLAEFQAQEEAILASYAWVEKDRGIARMPIAEALRIVAERGELPVFPSPPPEPGDEAAGGTR